MPIYPSIHRLLSRLYKYEFAKNFKDDVVVPLRHAVFGKKGFYLALDVAKDLEKKAGAGKAETIFDIGASIGDKAYVLAKTFPEANVYCFEPLRPSFRRLEKRMHPFGERAKLFNVGIYNRGGESDFYVAGNPERDPVSSGASSFVSPRGDRAGGEPIKAKVRRLDDFVSEAGIDKFYESGRGGRGKRDG